MALRETPVKKAASRFELPVYTPPRCRAPEFVEQVRALAPELIVLAAYGQILPASLLAIPPLGNLNLHASLLPKYRGAAPIQRAILEGETLTGVTIIQMTPELDAGDILAMAAEPIRPKDTYGSLEARLARLGAHLLLETLQHLQEGRLQPIPQEHSQATYAPPIKKEERFLQWQEPASRCHNRVRAFSPKPGAATFWRGRLVKIWSTHPEDGVGEPGVVLQVAPEGILVACGEGALRLLELQPEGRNRLTARDFINGYRVQPGSRFGE